MPSVTELGLKFVERCSRSSASVAAEDFQATIKQIGFAGGAGGAWSGVGKNRHHRFFFVNWPADWVELYTNSGWFGIDPLPIEARRRIAPFLLSELANLKFTAAQIAFMKGAADYGWREGFAVPIHGPGSLQGLVTMVTRRDEFSLSLSDRAVLEVMSRAVWERCRTSEGFGMVDEQGPAKLSAREIECLQWAAAGKSDVDMATLIGIRPATAHFHIEQAKRRLGVKTRVEAVAAGVLHGII
jgi:LuxR family quorum sensing-dependent transcriptional regulator